MTEQLHFIEHVHETGLGIVSRFICTGDRTSPCHIYPDDAEHFTPGASDGSPHDECWVAPWMNHQECSELCGPHGEPVRPGPITITFEDCVQWEYADEHPAPGPLYVMRPEGLRDLPAMTVLIDREDRPVAINDDGTLSHQAGVGLRRNVLDFKPYLPARVLYAPKES